MSYVPHEGPQSDLLAMRDVPEVLFGGARGGGKTAALLGDFLQDVARYEEHWQGVLFRRSYPELEEVIKQSHKFYLPTGAHWRASSKSWHWANGACLRLRSLESKEDASKYQGHEFSFIGWDEVTNWAFPDAYKELFACLRGSGKQVAARIRCSGNPGGPGHNWVKDRFLIGEHKKGWHLTYDEETNMSRIYIPSRTSDNPSLILNSPNYTRQLRAVGSKELVRAWLEGDWDIVLGAYFDEFSEQRHAIPDIEISDLPKKWKVYRAYDHGSYHPFAVLWYTYAGNEMKEFEPGTLIFLREWFGADETGKGLKMSVADIAEGMRRRERDFRRKVEPGPADNQIFENDGGMPLSEIMAGRGIYFERSDKRRIAGWNQVRYRLQSDLIKFCRACKHTILSIPTLQHDDHKAEDVDTTGNDHCFVGDTLVDTPNGQIPIKLLPEQGYTWTRNGWAWYDRASLKQSNVDVVEVLFDDGRKVRCTPDHRFLSASGGTWIEAKDLTGKQVYEAKCTLSKLIKQPKSLMGVDSIFVANTSNEMDCDCTEPFGLHTMVKYLKASISIIGTKIRQTIKSKILSCSAVESIFRSISNQKKPGNGTVFQSNLLGRSPSSGISLPKGESGIENIFTKIVRINYLFAHRSNAINAKQSFRLTGPETIALTPVSLSIGDFPEQTTKSEYASNVTPSSNAISIQSSSCAVANVEISHQAKLGPVALSVTPAGKADVYCLRVPRIKHFSILGGIIVHNCADVVRYASMAWPIQVQVEKIREDVRDIRTFNELIDASDDLMSRIRRPL